MTAATTLRNLSLLAAAGLAAGAAHAGSAWNEAVQGDLSNDGLAPTALLFSAGSNTVVGSTGDSGQGVDRDYFSFAVPAGASLTAIRLLGVTSVSGGSSFMALQAGPRLTVSPTGAGVENLLGFLHYGNDLIGSDLLPMLAAANPAGLPAGIYTAWVQETGGPASYGLDFTIASSVPEPSSGALVLCGLGVVGWAARRSRAADRG